jgi:hypothetical protein
LLLALHLQHRFPAAGHNARCGRFEEGTSSAVQSRFPRPIPGLDTTQVGHEDQLDQFGDAAAQGVEVAAEQVFGEHPADAADQRLLGALRPAAVLRRFGPQQLGEVLDRARVALAAVGPFDQ